MIENQFDTYYGEHHFNMFTQYSDSENHSDVLNSNEFSMKFNQTLQESYLPQSMHSLSV